MQIGTQTLWIMSSLCSSLCWFTGPMYSEAETTSDFYLYSNLLRYWKQYKLFPISDVSYIRIWVGRERDLRKEDWCSAASLLTEKFNPTLLILMPKYIFLSSVLDTDKSRATLTLNLQSFEWSLLFSAISLLLVMFLKFVTSVKRNCSPEAK